MSVESDALEAFTGAMSTSIIHRKLRVLKIRKDEIKAEEDRLKTELFARKYGEMTFDEIGQMWDNLEGYDERANAAFELPEIEAEFNGLPITCKMTRDVWMMEIFKQEWYRLEIKHIDIRGHFARYCKK